MTVGNSLRRVLLSSLPGAAVVGIKFKGVSHEFMPPKGVKEDVLEIMLNLKQLRFKVLADEEEVKLELKIKGKKIVKAGDIAKNSALEIKNPDCHLATLTDDKAELEMEIYVQKGRGYRMTEANKNEKGIGYIEIDSIFSPIMAVSIGVENVRVGKMTNWDKLVVSLKTDGTITPKEAFEQAATILVNQFEALLSLSSGEAQEEEVEAETETVVEGEAEIVEEKEEEAPKKKSKK
jgi:DNA-directed RNA polymerase subunit alpha